MQRIHPVAVFDCVVFGATGDLTLRKLLPALYYRFRDGQVPDESRIIGAARSPLSDEDFRRRAAHALMEHVDAKDLDAKTRDRFLDRLFYLPIDAAAKDADWSRFQAMLDPDRVRVFYFATSPSLYGPITQALGGAGLVTEKSRVVLEKPIGHDLPSALRIIDSVGAVFREDQTFRIDHYLGKETVQNLLALRFANTIFERLWSSDVIDHVQITVAETVGLEGRAGYYDHSGALRDMLQNHMLQLLCLIAMEPPVSLDADRVRDEKLKVLRALKPMDPHDVPTLTVRGQYTQGAIDGQPVPGYLTDLGSDKPSRTESFVALKAEICSWRWANVPFYLRTGKRLPQKVSEIVIQFKALPFSIFPAEAAEWQPNRLIIRLQPEEGMRLGMMTKDPGPGGMRLSPTALDIRFEKTFGHRFPDAYERLLMDTVRGDPTLFMRRDEVEAAWTWVEPILEAWAGRPDHPRPYPAGSWGPTSSIALIERDGRTWHEGAD
ncbi:glucose-6-phosphate dehydrogenase [Rhodopila sp.]|jgi:glucose-6-phosphate 1-dehydrogenase|uniref:glucose-6-phosphate dehydrogenase n=1 Tax=Rhodopila sp. TaxID=2480087 RepID=UPI002B972AE4|nr:glucose-6-phosphate dehydrogenase [Rhodopila sp.]HVZ07533.1 glucose-6-phosphate dehydrogenase [Rhodopila sp.]